MKIYPKILLITLPLIVLSVLLTGIIAQTISRSAIRNVVEDSLALRLNQTMSTLEQDKTKAPGSEDQIRRGVIENLKTIRFGRTGNVFVIDQRGKIIGHQDENIEGMDVGSRQWFALMDQTRVGKIQFVLEGENHWGVYSYFKPWGWFVVCCGYEEDLAGPIANLGQTVLLLVMFCLVGAAIPLLIFARWLTRPIYTLIQGTEKIRAGNLETHIPIATSDEIGILAGAFNATTAQLRKLIESLEERNDQLNKEIKERVSIQEELAQSELKYRSIFDNAVEGIFQSNCEGRFANVNNSFASILGYESPEEVKAKLSNISEQVYVIPEDREKFLKLLNSHGLVTGFECQVKRKDCSIGWISMSARSTRDEFGNVQKIDGYCVDISTQKDAEREKHKLEAQLLQSQKMESVGRLAGGIAHDFNNMLSVILGHCELALLKIRPGQPFHERFQGIQNAAGRSNELTRRLLAFARKQTIKPRVLDLNETVSGMLNMLRQLIGEDIDLVWLPDRDLWLIKADPTQIDQILANLCVNARDAISGVGKLTIETGNMTFDQTYCADHPGFYPGDFALLAVSDNGCGMDSETITHLFEPFFTTKERGKGTGLGLATIYGIVKQNEGFINVYSEPEQGSTFKIYLPRYMGDKERTAKANTMIRNVEGWETILLVEDEPMILEITTNMLKELGYKVLPAATPGEAIRLVGEQAEEIHLLLTDVVMPEMNGKELAKNLTSIYPNLKLLFMSGYTANVIAHHGILDEGIQFIQKPLSMKDLAAKIREVLNKKFD